MEGMHRITAIDPGLVRAKAYEIWQSLGCPDGAAEQTWFEAERQLNSRTPAPESTKTISALRPVAEVRAATIETPASAPEASAAPISEPPASSTSNKASKKSNASPRRNTRR